MNYKLLLYLVALSTLIISGCIISGTVMDEFGNGIEGVTVKLGGDASGEAITDSSGKYQFGDYFSAPMEVGTYTVTPSKDEYTFEPSSSSVTIINGTNDIPMPVTNVNFKASGGDGEGVPLTLSNLNFPGTVTAGKVYDGTVDYQGIFEYIDNPLIVTEIPYGTEGYSMFAAVHQPETTASDGVISFGAYISKGLSGNGKIYFTLVDYDENSGLRDNLTENSMSDTVYKIINIERYGDSYRRINTEDVQETIYEKSQSIEHLDNSQEYGLQEMFMETNIAD